METKTYKSQAARDAKAQSYGKQSYWDYLEQSALEHYDYYMKKGDEVKAQEMLNQSLSESLRGNEGD